MHQPDQTQTSSWRIAIVALVALTLGIFTDHWLHAHSQSFFSGELSAASEVIQSPYEGVIESWHIFDDEQVSPGHELATISRPQLTAQIQDKADQIRRIRSQIQQMEAESKRLARSEQEVIEKEIFQTELRHADLLKQQYDEQMNSLAWKEVITSRPAFHQTLQQAEHLSTSSDFDPDQIANLPHEDLQLLLKYEAVQNSLETINAQLELCENRSEQLKHRLENLAKESLEGGKVTQLELDLEQAEASLQSLKSEQAEVAIVCETEGIVSCTTGQKNSPIQAGETLAIVFDPASVKILAKIPSNSIHLFQVDQAVTVHFPGNNIRSGIVTSVGKSTSQSKEFRLFQSQPTIDVHIESCGALWPTIPIGSQIDISL